MRVMRTERIAVADGIELAVDIWAPDAGVPSQDPRATFVLVHGLASNARIWDGVAEHLTAAGHPVVSVDLRGHGRSSKPDGPYDVPAVAEDLAALVAALGLDRPVAAGQSWGGNVVLELAARRPTLLRGIVCVDGGWLEPSRVFPDWETCRRVLAPPQLAGRPLAEIEGHIRAAHPDWPEVGIRGALANFELRADGTVAPWLTFERHLAVLRGLWDHRPSDRYAAVEVPVLLVPVEDDRPLEDDQMPGSDEKRAVVAAAAAALRTCRVRWFRGDHDIHAQRPAELAATMRAAATDGFFE
jgi:pimeloyl-ACP methyl ester carboxylesterase